MINITMLFHGCLLCMKNIILDSDGTLSWISLPFNCLFFVICDHVMVQINKGCVEKKVYVKGLFTHITHLNIFADQVQCDTCPATQLVPFRNGLRIIAERISEHDL